MIADETVGTTEEEIMPFLQEKGHPALKMESIIDSSGPARIWNALPDHLKPRPGKFVQFWQNILNG
jgi:hypothetical protein